MQDIKRVIRETEAVAGIRTLGLDDRAARFLDLPFYRTGTVEKDADRHRRTWRSCARCSRRWPPTSMFVAGDLSDPHGTHRMCKEAIERALAEYVAAGGAGPRCGSIAARGRSGR